MTATITSMDYYLADVLNSDQLEINDLIGLGSEVVKILLIQPTKTGLLLTIENEFGEKDEVEIKDEDKIELYVMV
jgi:hypothetical protein